MSNSPATDGTPSALAYAVANPETVLPLYQPIVSLDDRTVVGFEALARWPESEITNPVSVFDYARAHGSIGEVDWACRLAAVQGGLDAGLGDGHVLFVNVEPDALDPSRTPPPARAAQVFDAAAEAGIQLVLELTERAVLFDPATVMRTVAAARDFGHAIALDDVGVNPESMALLPLIAPDVIKLDRSLVQSPLAPHSLAVMCALEAHISLADPVVLAEGIETAVHLDTARAWGASLGQGRFFGHPAALPQVIDLPSRPLRLQPRPAPIPETPSHILDRLDVRIGGAPLLLSLGQELAEHAMKLDEPASVLATFATAAQFTPTVAARFSALAEVHPLVAVLAGGAGLGPEPATGVRGGQNGSQANLVDEWALTVVGQHSCVALIVRELDSSTRNCDDRQFEFALTHNRDHVIDAARSLVQRIVPCSATTKEFTT